MNGREEVLTLKASRSGYKGLTTRAKKATLDALESHSDNDDPFYLESKIRSWETKLNQYRDAEAAVVCHAASDDKDVDKDLDLHEDEFDRAQLRVRGIRQDFDRDLTTITGRVADSINHIPQQPGLPKLNIKRPPTLEEDTNLRSFLQWIPLWNNYATLIALSKRDRVTQVSLLWECCSPGFLQIVHHSLGIKPDTGRDVNDIINIIKDYLRSLRSVHLDMRDLLQVKQQDGQDYTSLCNIIRELAEFADVAHITEDKLLIALLLQAMKSESDKAKVMEKNPKTFDEARHHILELETSRRGAKGMTVSSQVNAARSTSSYKAQKKVFPKSSSRNCDYCGLASHPRDKCPAQRSHCRSCKRKGHWDRVCKFQNVKETTNTYESNSLSPSRPRVGSLKLRVASLMVSSEVSNRVEINVLPSKYEGKPMKVTFCADTGADVCVMGLVVFQESGLEKIVVLSRSSSNQIIGIDGKPVRQLGMFAARLQVQGVVADGIPIVVCQDLQDAFLSLTACKALTIIGDNFPYPKHMVASALLTKQNVHSDHNLLWKEREIWISQLPNEVTSEVFPIVDAKLRKIYSQVFESETLRPMRGPVVGDPMIIHLKDDAKPFAIHVARQIPFAYDIKVKNSLTSMVKQEIIAPVGDEVTEW